MIKVNGKWMSLENVEIIAKRKDFCILSVEAKKRINSSRKLLERLMEEGSTLYGVNTGFGKFAEVNIGRKDLGILQKNLILSHSAGVGEPLSEEEVRAAILLRAHTLSMGYSGVRLAIVEKLLELLNKRVYPFVPEIGSVGASGDLAPLAHIGLVMIGRGEAFYDGKRIPGREALNKARISPIKLSAKEGVGLINGTQVMTGIGVLLLLEALRIVKIADIAGALTTEALRGTPVAFEEVIQNVRPYQGQRDCAWNLRKMLCRSEIRKSHKNCKKVQDAYSIRCMPQVHGAVREVLGWVRKVLEIEVNSVTDNPLVFLNKKRVLSGGNFHGEIIAFAMDFLSIALCELGNISERRIARLVDSNCSGLPAFLIKDGGLNSGMMMAQVTASALVSESKVLSHPASTDSIPTSGNQEDHVSMGLTAARKARKILENTRRILGIELLCACQGIDMLFPLLSGVGSNSAYKVIRSQIHSMIKDRELYIDIDKMVYILKTGKLLKEVEKSIGKLR